MGVKKKKKSSNSIYIMVFILLLVSFLLILYYSMDKNEKYDISNLLVDRNYDVVYLNNNIPTINLLGEEIDNINNEIVELYTTNNNDDQFEYEYDVSSDSFSFLLKRFIMIDDQEYIEFKTYVIDLETMHNMDNEDIYNKFDIDENTLVFFIKNKFLNYYVDLVEKGYFNKKACDFDCFIFNCNFQDYIEDIHFYIKNDHLYMYKFFNIFTDYEYDDYFSYNDFIFEVK